MPIPGTSLQHNTQLQLKHSPQHTVFELIRVNSKKCDNWNVRKGYASFCKKLSRCHMKWKLFLHSHQQWRIVPIAPYLCQCFMWSGFCISAILTFFFFVHYFKGSKADSTTRDRSRSDQTQGLHTLSESPMWVGLKCLFQYLLPSRCALAGTWVESAGGSTGTRLYNMGHKHLSSPNDWPSRFWTF